MSSFSGPFLKPQKRKKTRKELRRGSPLKPSNPKRKAQRYARNFASETPAGPGHDEFIRDLSCAVYGCNRRPIEAAHTTARGAGGTGSSWRQIVPLCRTHHTGKDGQEGRTEEFGEVHGLDLHALAGVLVIVDPGVLLVEKLEAWRRLEAYSQASRLGALQRGYDLCGYTLEPPQAAE